MIYLATHWTKLCLVTLVDCSFWPQSKAKPSRPINKLYVDTFPVNNWAKKRSTTAYQIITCIFYGRRACLHNIYRPRGDLVNHGYDVATLREGVSRTMIFHSDCCHKWLMRKRLCWRLDPSSTLKEQTTGRAGDGLRLRGINSQPFFFYRN